MGYDPLRFGMSFETTQIWHKEILAEGLGKTGEVGLQLVIAFRNFARGKIHVDDQVLHASCFVNPVPRSSYEHGEPAVDTILERYLGIEGESVSSSQHVSVVLELTASKISFTESSRRARTLKMSSIDPVPFA
jgi:hypothetical protein